MKTLTILILAALLSACGGAPSSSTADSSAPTGTGSGGGTGGTGGSGGSGGGPATHVYQMQVTANDADFTYAPAIIGTNGNENNPGLETVNGVGNTQTYQLTDTQANFQITGVSATNNAFSVSVVVLKDGVQMVSWTIGVGVSEQINE